MAIQVLLTLDVEDVSIVENQTYTHYIDGVDVVVDSVIVG